MTNVPRLTIVIEPSEIVGQWVAHCLELDLVLQGNSVQHACEMIGEAIALVVEDDARSGLDLLRRRAPQEYWNKLRAH